MADDLSKLEEWIGGIMAGLVPAERRQLARQIGVALRRSNTIRIRANVEPDGTGMEPRKPRPERFADKKNGRVRRKGAMFPRLRMARNLKVAADGDGVEVAFRGQVQRNARVHHYGLLDHVRRGGNGPRVRYAARPLLGFSSEDETTVLDAVEEWMAARGR